LEIAVNDDLNEKKITIQGENHFCSMKISKEDIWKENLGVVSAITLITVVIQRNKGIAKYFRNLVCCSAHHM